MINWFSTRVTRKFNEQKSFEQIVIQQMVLTLLDIHMEKSEVGPLLHTILLKIT